METIEEYLARKRDELHLLNSCLRSPLDVADPMSVMKLSDTNSRSPLRSEPNMPYTIGRRQKQPGPRTLKRSGLSNLNMTINARI
jgi:hypothetical protein